MNKFLTLIKRDLADYKGALILTPLVISGVILALVMVSLMMGTFHVNGTNFQLFGSGDVNITADDGNSTHLHKNAGGQLVYTDENGLEKPVIGNLPPKQIAMISQMVVIGNMMGALLPLFIAMIVVLFVLSGSLYEERKDKSIMFWKSMPISDIETVGAKMVSVAFIGLGFALLVTFALHLILVIIATIGSNQIGLGIMNIPAALNTMAELWLLVAIVLFAYILWAFPVYAWILAASSYAPKAPFLLAFVPVVLLPLLAKIFLRDATAFFMEPLYHITGYPVWNALSTADNAFKDAVTNQGDYTLALIPLINTFKEPSLWIGLVVGAALLYAASEIRRRRSF